MTDGQYSLDADPMVLAKRVQTLENACDVLSGALMDLARTTRLLLYQCEDLAAHGGRELQEKSLYELREDFHRIERTAHHMSTLMGRSY